jgi:hypothetical protein
MRTPHLQPLHIYIYRYKVTHIIMPCKACTAGGCVAVDCTVQRCSNAGTCDT